LIGELDAAETQLNQVKARLNNGEGPPMVEAVVAEDMTIMQHRRELDRIEFDISHLSGDVGLESNPMQRLVRQKDFMQQKLDDAQADARAKARVAVHDQLAAAVTVAQRQLESLDEH